MSIFDDSDARFMMDARKRQAQNSLFTFLFFFSLPIRERCYFGWTQDKVIGFHLEDMFPLIIHVF